MRDVPTTSTWPSTPGYRPRPRVAVFDFDGTLSLLRRGWEDVMQGLMTEVLVSAGAMTPEAAKTRVSAYIDRSTGILTIDQMRWLARAVTQVGSPAKSPQEYKAQYSALLQTVVDERLTHLADGTLDPTSMLVPGGREFLEALAGQDIPLLLVSGTDHDAVVREAMLLGVGAAFQDICGAVDGSRRHSKSVVVRALLQNYRAEDILVVGDGPVEIRVARKVGATALGIASNEFLRTGWHPGKLARLRRAKAHIVIPDFSDRDGLLAMLSLSPIAA